MDNFINKNIPTLYTLQLNPLFFFYLSSSSILSISLSLFMATRLPFTDSQWEELENQTLVFKYLAANAPVPPHLLFLIRRPFLFSTSSSPSTFFSPHRIGWNNVYEMGMGRKMVDAEPGRCRRTDGKKWRCSKEASHESKYCERHMHRGKNRSSRKPLPPPLAPPQFSVSSTLNLSLHSGGSCGYQKEKQPEEEQHCFILGTDLSEKLKERGEEKDYDEEEKRSKRFYRFLDEWPSSKSSSVSTSLFI